MDEPGRDSAPQGPRGARSEAEVRWTEARRFLAGRLRGELRGLDAESLDDLTQEALTRLLRSVRREGVLNLEALMTSIAHRTAIDHIRRHYRWAKLVESVPDPAEAPGALAVPAAGPPGDSLERLRFVVLEFFARNESGCHELACAYFDGRDWRRVAQTLGRSHDAVRRQWSRCVGALRAEAARDRGLLMDWAAGGDPSS
jgi:DNA-directed RNA polymerase specialized sigma24 family protein